MGHGTADGALGVAAEVKAATGEISGTPGAAETRGTCESVTSRHVMTDGKTLSDTGSLILDPGWRVAVVDAGGGGEEVP